MEKEKVLEGIKKLREQEKRKFNQSIDLIINLKNFDVKRESVNLFMELPNKIKDKKVAAFLNKKSSIIDTVTKTEFDSYKEKNKIKKLIKNYDFFLASASLMPQLAANFGRYLGPSGKMPSPQLGVLKEETEQEIKKTLDKLNKSVRIKSKEPSLKFIIGKEDMKDEEIVENIIVAYTTILNALPKKKENLKSILIKLTMGNPIKIE